LQAVILGQDRPIAESQRPEELPVDLSAEFHIAGPDRASIAYWRGLREPADTPD
jgi:vanillate O-demethylase monooxygenase subunit